MRTNILLLGFLLLSFGWLATSAGKPKNTFNGEWGIETVIVANDTLYHMTNMSYTARLLSSQLSQAEMSDAAKEYEHRCIRSTFNNFKQVRLIIKRKVYSLSVMLPCWDHFKFPKIDDGYCLQDSEQISLYTENSKLLMSLNSDGNNTQLTYYDSKLQHKIIFKRFSEINNYHRNDGL